MTGYSWLFELIVNSAKLAYYQDKGYHNMLNLIPSPTSMISDQGEFFLSNSVTIQADSSNEELTALASYLSAQMQNTVGSQFPVSSEKQQTGIALQLDHDSGLGEEGYELTISPEGIRLRANQPAGMFYAIQTLLQIIPAHPSETITLPAVSIRDTPRFTWRGAMLDVARHFFGVEDVKRYIDLISHYKMNRLHLHLSDDQGWRIEIKSWPKLTEIGGRTQVGGQGGGFYTQEQYKEIVDYARSRSVMIIPEIDTPGHTNAALASYPELNESEEAPDLYEGTQVGFSTLSVNRAVTYQFLDDVIGELAEITPAPYIHIGGDEARSTPADQFKTFIKRIQEIVISHGKTPIGWTEIGGAEILPGTIVQHWVGTIDQAARQHPKVILSPSTKAYLDMKYDSSTPIGLNWAGLISVKDSYNWEPGDYIKDLDENDILGIEGPLWTETVLSMKDIEYLTFPRLPGLAELAWSPKGHNWNEYRQRLGAHGKRMQAMGINFYRSPDVDWE
jgi:hexosaminidase